MRSVFSIQKKQRLFTQTAALLSLVSLQAPTHTSAFAPASFLLPSVVTPLFLSTAATMPETLQVVQLPCLNDNYGYLLHDATTGATAAVDTPEAGPYQAELRARGWTLTHIFNTHHHWDHTGGNLELKSSEVSIYGPATETIPGIDRPLRGDDEFEFGGSKVQVIDVGGHTKGHIAYYFPDERKVFVGDSLFALGCGKMFEGTPEQFWGSLKRLRSLPDDTMVYCAHEYTQSNAKFAQRVEPGNAELLERVKEIAAQRARGEPTVPSLLGLEKRTNPFLRCDVSDELRANVGVREGDSDAEAFAKVRRAKDTFRG
ncbi:hydroxyacylglutathione hydrolase [Fistulifera solaris]|uniref:hydroxyacylglutathione hydrolase n=1 Tax=Fistulifera solaris TaxID=1519565 RepID=A0A1Z5KJ55_FISSO|nr:hydroxyacylglutathione hydrolase [Fistulifera solaris]|eukprot:GAX25988.1 hydroxyacylglutathione hydrolase [Fistulifera solaris]